MVTRARKTMMSNPLDDIAPAKKSVIKKSVIKKSEQAEPETKSSSAKKPILNEIPDEVVQPARVKRRKKEPEVDAEMVMIEALNESKNDIKNVPLSESKSETEQPDTQLLTAEDVFAKELCVVRVEPARTELVRVESEHKNAATQCVRRWSQWSVVASLVPLPLLDILAMSGAQVKMIHELCRLYNVDFERKIALAVATGLASGTLTKSVASNATRAVARSLPGLGTVMTVAFEPALAFGTTYAIGAAFISHFEADGTLHDFNPETMKDSFADHLNRGKALFKQSKKVS